MSKAIAIGYLTKVSAANVNASYTEGNVIVAKRLLYLMVVRFLTFLVKLSAEC